VEFVVNKVALGQVFSEYFGFPCQFSFLRLLHTHHLSSGAGTIGQILADVPSGLSFTPPQKTKKKLRFLKEHDFYPLHQVEFGSGARRHREVLSWGVNVRSINRTTLLEQQVRLEIRDLPLLPLYAFMVLYLAIKITSPSIDPNSIELCAS
jgi:hypothetical protein